jgi:sugar/nucleoside kinase (ribokinase family)
VAVRLLAVGDVLIDVTASGEGHDARVRLVPGGSATNVALEAVRSGADAVLLGRVGDDAAGRMLRSELAGRGVRPSLSIDPERPTGTFLVVDGEVRVDRGATAAYLPDHIPSTLDADVTLVSGHLPADTVAACLERSRATWSALAPARLERLPEGGNAVFVDEGEAERLTGAPPAEAVRLLGDRYRLACMTLGARGAIGVLDGAVHTATADERVVSATSIGAGDAFAGSVLVALASGSTLFDALDGGCRAGALALSGPQ